MRQILVSLQPSWSDCFIIIQQQASLCGCQLIMRAGNAKLILCAAQVHSVNMSYIGFICIFCYLPVQALILGPVVNICPLISPRLLCIVLTHRTHRRGTVFIVSLQASILQISLALLSRNNNYKKPTHSFQFRRDLASQMSETNIFSFKKEVKCICI